MRKSAMVLLVLLTVFVGIGIAQEVSSGDLASNSPIHKLPWWGGIAAVAGLNIALVGVKKALPKIPAYLLPIVNIGLGAGLGWLGVGVQVPPAATTAVALSGAAALVHNVVKNVLRGDAAGQESVIVPDK